MALTTVRCVLFAAALAATSACGSEDVPQPDQATAMSTTKSAAPSQAFGPAQSEGVIDKKVGEPAGLNCPQDPDLPCDLNFTVTAIQQNATCAASIDQPGPGEQFLRFDVDAFSSNGTFEFPDSADALLLPNWSVDGTGGSMRQLHAIPECSSGAAPLTAAVSPGTRIHARIVVRAPKPAVTLRVSWQSLMWEWAISGID